MHVFTLKPLFLNEDKKVSAFNILTASSLHLAPPKHCQACCVPLYLKIYRVVFSFVIPAGIWP